MPIATHLEEPGARLPPHLALLAADLAEPDGLAAAAAALQSAGHGAQPHVDPGGRVRLRGRGSGAVSVRIFELLSTMEEIDYLNSKC